MFSFRLQQKDGTPADAPTLKAAYPTGDRATRFRPGKGLCAWWTF
jgi:hypothetical protein